MLYPRVDASPEGVLTLRFLPPVMAMALRQLPLLLSDDAPGIRDHLERTSCPGDPEAAAQWDRYAAPDLAHLFRSARAVVEGDLEALAGEPRKRGRFLLPIPPAHLAAWLSSLAAARVTLSDVHSIGEAEMESALPEEIVSDRDRSILLIHLLGWIQGLLLEAGA